MPLLAARPPGAGAPQAAGRMERLTYRLKKADRKGNTVRAFTGGAVDARQQPDSSARPPDEEVPGILAGGARDRKLAVPKATDRKRARAHPERVMPTASPVKWAELLKRERLGLDARNAPSAAEG